MPTRGKPPGISERVAFIEEQLRGLQRLPGAVVPPPSSAGSVGGSGGMREEMWAFYGSLPLMTTTGGGSVGVNWITDIGQVLSAGDHPPRPRTDTPTRLIFPDGGFYLLQLAVSGVDSANPFTPSERITMEVTTYMANGNPREFFQVLAVPWLDDAILIGETTVFAHIHGGEELEAVPRWAHFVTAHEVSVAVIASRIGQALPNVPY